MTDWKFFYAAVKQKDGKYFKTSSLRKIRAAIERYLKQLPLNKPWSIVGDPAFASANKVLNAICRKNAQEGNACPVVHKPQASTAAFPNRPGQLGECDIQDPAQFLRRPISISPSILVKESVKIKESLQKKCCHSSQPPKVANLMSLEICWELKATKAACMIATMNQTAKCLRFWLHWDAW